MFNGLIIISNKIKKFLWKFNWIFLSNKIIRKNVYGTKSLFFYFIFDLFYWQPYFNDLMMIVMSIDDWWWSSNDFLDNWVWWISMSVDWSWSSNVFLNDWCVNNWSVDNWGSSNVFCDWDSFNDFLDDWGWDDFLFNSMMIDWFFIKIRWLI